MFFYVRTILLDGSSDSLLLDSLPTLSGHKLKELLYTGRTLLNQADYAHFVLLKRLLWLNITSVTFINGTPVQVPGSFKNVPVSGRKCHLAL
jgi:hypothetical protein